MLFQDHSPFLDFALTATLGMFVAGLVLSLVRILLGPTLPDRAVGLDLITTLAVGIGAVYAIATHQAIFMDMCIAVALVSFLGTVGFARYTEMAKTLDDHDTEEGS